MHDASVQAKEELERRISDKDAEIERLSKEKDDMGKLLNSVLDKCIQLIPKEERDSVTAQLKEIINHDI